MVNAKELIIIQGYLRNTKMNSIPFMIAHMLFVLKKGGPISFCCLVTSIARALRSDTELAILEPLPPRTVNINFLRDIPLQEN